MIGHDHKLINLHIGKMFWYIESTLIHNASHIIQHHDTIDDLTKIMNHILGTYRDKISTIRIISSSKSIGCNAISIHKTCISHSKHLRYKLSQILYISHLRKKRTKKEKWDGDYLFANYRRDAIYRIYCIETRLIASLHPHPSLKKYYTKNPPPKRRVFCNSLARIRGYIVRLFNFCDWE